ncbi:MAG TPA: hypothetical protein VGM91_22785 [Conexibacter sp.]|jgi:hypothetical protein
MITINLIGVGMLVLAYLSAVVDGTMQDGGLYPSRPGRTGLRRYAAGHPWIVGGAILGAIGTILAVV